MDNYNISESSYTKLILDVPIVLKCNLAYKALMITS